MGSICSLRILRGAHPPDFSAGIVGNQQCAIMPYGDADGATVSFELALIGNKTGEDIFHRADGFAVVERDKGDFKADHLGAVPRAMHADEGAAVIARGERLAVIKS